MRDLKFDFRKSIIVKHNAPVLIEDNKVYAQNIKIEAITVEGDLWHDLTYGWSLVDFMHRNIDEMLKLELQQRVRDKLSKRPYVDVNSLQLELTEKDDCILIEVSFCINEEATSFIVALNRTTAEVSIVE